jgi:peptidoglycan/xylan/chitin deacetylase (PgdA/CDA1 family)
MNALLAVLLLLPAVVMYHRVDALSPGDVISRRLTISPQQFAGELSAIHRMGLHTIGIEELVRDLIHRQMPAHAVLLTFDDGYDDQYGYAFPILRRFGDRATFFVNTATVGSPRHLTWQEIVAMERGGMSMECHGVDHVDLATLGPAAQRYQIDACVRTLSARLRAAVLAFAYPSGAFDAFTVLFERQAGLVLGFTTDPRFANNLESPYQITRIRVLSGMSDAFFASLLSRTRSYVEVPH